MSPHRFENSATVHSVHFYHHDDALIERLRSITVSAMQAGDSALVVLTEPHERLLRTSLDHWGLETQALERNGRLIIYNAQELLALFMAEGSPDPSRFTKVLGQLIAGAREASRSRNHGVIVFGEMVAYLWDCGNRKAALELERLWNRFLETNRFHLHCAYNRNLFLNGGEWSEINAICEEHSHVIGAAAA
jgi:hypothetical protein